MALETSDIVILGGASGIGAAVARAAVRQGARVTIAGRTVQRLEVAAEEIGAQYAVVDAGDSASLKSWFQERGPFNHLVMTMSTSATSLGVQNPLQDINIDNARTFVDGKFWAQMNTVQAALPHIAAPGSITFTSGVASRRSLPGHSIIAANNAAIDAAAQQLAKELAPIRVNVVSPGLTNTSVYDHLSDDAKAAFYSRVTSNMPVPRAGEPDEIADAFLFCMSSPYLTGTIIDIDGGFLVQ